MKSTPLHFSIRRSLFALPSLLLALQAPSADAAALSLGPVSGSSTTTTHEYSEDYSAWFLADFSVDPDAPDPIQVTTGIAVGWWTQELTFPAAFPSLITGDIFNIQELVQISPGGFPVDNWKQEIVTPGWEWVAASIFDNNTSSEVPGLQVLLNGATASFTFDPLTAGTDLFIIKELRYTGAGGAAAPLSVRVSAVPEPATSVLGLIGVTALFIRKRRH
ncbi:hypothetical protein JIN84_03990 [Luteolibacter yonseiensis]|uniref:Ice-binding protein C-terminal domain-containing protein n=1 Tax=Luteolibacter yonseiensis TaxID=1144680 RepID=A0A934VA39_9BACT|nr:PEP-CTERM sorting domain-containing protein [Luteolibacter yonseiensis]MBK1814760.1 hypothetical protein [Luteolibacter yonseiensis]